MPTDSLTGCPHWLPHAGFVLEETIAWLLRYSGYRLLTSPDDDRDELAWAGNGLLVRGRGADHQADVLGAFTFVPRLMLLVCSMCQQ